MKLLSGLCASGLALVVTACGGTNASSSTDADGGSPSSATSIEVTLTFRTDDDVPKGKGAGYEYCSGGNKIKIRVTNEEDEVLSTTFGVAEPPPEDKPALVADWLNGRCTINAVLEGIPAGEKFYTIEAETGESQFNARSGAVTYSNAEMEAAQWKADLEITTSAE